MIAALLLTAAVQAGVVTVLTPSIGAPDPGFSGALVAGVDLDRGNTDNTDFTGSLSTRWVDEGGDHQLLLVASGAYKVSQGVLNTQDAFGHLRYRWAFLEGAPLTWFSFLQAQHNAFQSLRVRDLAGTGLEYRLWRLRWTEAWVGQAVMAEYEQLSDGSPATLVPRGSSSLLLAVQLDEALTLGSSTYFQPQLLRWSDWRILEELRLSGSFGRHLGWTGGVTYAYDRVPAGAVGPLDLSVSSGLSYRW